MDTGSLHRALTGTMVEIARDLEQLADDMGETPTPAQSNRWDGLIHCWQTANGALHDLRSPHRAGRAAGIIEEVERQRALVLAGTAPRPAPQVDDDDAAPGEVRPLQRAKAPTRAALRHLPGKHNQKKHSDKQAGSGGGSSGGSSGGGKAKADSDKPKPAADEISDEEYAARQKMIEDTIGSKIKNKETTEDLYAIDTEAGVWEAERAKLHRQIVNDIYKRYEGVPNDGRGVMAGGLGGAGKSTVLKMHKGIDPDKFVTLNPDDVKEEMAKRGLVPDVPGLSPMETSALVHEESSHIANLLAKKAYADRKNVIWDITMASPGSAKRRVDEMREAGYDDLEAVFVDIPVEKSVERALSRHRRGLEDYRKGKGLGGRYVPPSIIRKNASDKASSQNRETFDQLRTEFDRFALYDNSGTAPTMVSKGAVFGRK